MSKPKVVVYHGPPCCGKTQKAVFPLIEAKIEYDFQCFDYGQKLCPKEYKNETILVMENFDGSQIEFDSLIRILKGDKFYLGRMSYHYAHVTKIIITTPTFPSDWYRDMRPRDHEELKELLGEIIEMKLDSPPVFGEK